MRLLKSSAVDSYYPEKFLCNQIDLLSLSGVVNETLTKMDHLSDQKQSLFSYKIKIGAIDTREDNP